VIDMKTITALEFYSGYDPGTEHDFTLQEGESIEISDEKFEQLDRDGLLERFEVGKAAAKKAEPKSDDPDADLEGLKKPELVELADSIGIGDPEKLKVDELKQAIKSARHGDDGEQGGSED
jgi:hypothetical protein